MRRLRIRIARALVALAQAMLTFPINTATNCDVDECKWLYYASYRFCAECSLHEDLPYDQQLDGTDLIDWEREVGS